MSREIHTLSNGATVIINALPHVKTASVGFYFTVGSRFESKDNNGAAHFLEHMAFKGTTSRDALQISLDMEDRGANANAFTGNEYTCYFLHGLAEDAGEFVNILADISHNSTFPEEEVNRERGAIIQEIGMYADDPMSTAHDHASMTAFPGQPLGATILGPVENIRNMTRQTLADFHQEHYHAGNLIISVAGNVDPAKILDDIEKAASHIPAKPKSTFEPARYEGGHHHEERDTQQLNLVMEFQAAAKDSNEAAAESVLGIILGGGMSSRLFQEIREKRGLVYGVGSGVQAHHDIGTFHIVAGTGPEEISELMPVLCEELRKIQDEPVSQDEIERARAKVLAGAARSEESVNGRMIAAAMDFNYYGRLVDTQEKIDAIRNVTAEDVQEAAKRIFSTKPTVSTVGPGANVEPYEQILQRLGLKP